MKISASDFKARCLELMDRVNDFREEVIITKHGRAVARLVPVAQAKQRSIFGHLEGSVAIKGDIVAPIEEVWDATR